MSGAQTATQAAGTEAAEGVSILDQVIGATKQTAPDQAQDLMKNLVEQAMSGTVTFDKNLTRTFDRAIAAIDQQAVGAAQRDHARSEVSEAGRQLARPALSGHEQRDQHEPEDPLAQRVEARSVTRSAARGGI